MKFVGKGMENMTENNQTSVSEKNLIAKVKMYEDAYSELVIKHEELVGMFIDLAIKIKGLADESKK